ncbi:MAG: YibE/F family protein [Patescibacteria group bacterium]|nr:YibE/F family protein [Patescibacteria group bacterium]
MKKIIIILFLLLLLPLFAFADNSRVNVYFFYSNDCARCFAEKEFIKDLTEEVPEIKLSIFEIQDNQNNANLLKTLSQKFDIGVLNVPLLIVGDKIFSDFHGTDNNEKKIRAIIKDYLTHGYKNIVVQSIDSNEDKQTLVFAQLNNELQDKIFKAEVIKIIKQQQTVLPGGAAVEQQDLLLRGLEQEFKDREIEFNGIGELDVIKKNIYQVGDKVLVAAIVDHEGNIQYYITDYVRTGNLWWLAIVFVLSLFIVGGWKGLRSLIALIITFFIIIKYIIPNILAGSSPLLIVSIGSLMILLIIIYLTEGIKARSHIAVVSIFLSLIITIVLSWLFVNLTKLTGLANEEVSFLINIGEQAINFRGLLLAGIIIGALGVLDDVVISQVATVEQLIKANPFQSRREIFKRAYKVGVSHISSMTNTLFLAYAGVSLPLLILFVSGRSAFNNWWQVINNEAIATEIVRALAGSVGLIMAVPIATAVAARWLKRRR